LGLFQRCFLVTLSSLVKWLAVLVYVSSGSGFLVPFQSWFLVTQGQVRAASAGVSAVKQQPAKFLVIVSCSGYSGLLAVWRLVSWPA
jgi:hypothetical protein